MVRRPPASRFIPPAWLPDGAVVEVSGDGQQTLSEEIETPPNQEDSRRALHDPQHADEGPALRERHSGELFQARRADDTVLVLRDALAAIELGARRAARGRLAPGVIEAPLVRHASHGPS